MSPLRVIRISDVTLMTGLSRATIYRKIRTDGFPAPVRLGRSMVGWLEHEVEAWIESLPRAEAFEKNHKLS